MQIQQLLYTRKRQLEDALSAYSITVASAPKGSLISQKIKGKWQYYQKKYIDKKPEMRYLGSGEMHIAAKLAEKVFARKRLSAVNAELKSINAFLENYDPEHLNSIVSKINPGVLKLLEPVSDIDYILDSSWKNPVNQHFSMFSEHLKLKTQKGDLVRSKSELMIADTLFILKLLYQYEKALHLSCGKTFYPDFTIIGCDNNVYYWEHVGRLDDPEYLANFIKKMYYYSLDGIIPGKNLILTFENSEYPLSPTLINQMAEYYLL